MGTPRLHIRPDNPDFLDLPWDTSLVDWQHERLVDMPTGIHRHPVAFVAYEQGVYAIKEMPVETCRREFEVLKSLEARTHRAARPAGVVERSWLASVSPQSGAVITRYVRHAFPYRRLVMGSGFGPRRAQMLDAFAGLLVELHIGGCFWGDCSLSNVLYRFDAGAIEAIMVDAETSFLHRQLSDGQRLEDLAIMKENLAGEMADIAAGGGLEVDQADLALGEDIEARYEGLWHELNEELIITRNEGYRIRERIGRLQDVGFSVDDVEIEPTEAGDVVQMRIRVAGRTFHSDRLRELTGIEASENQAKVILSDLDAYLARTGDSSATGKSVGTFKWLTGSFQPIVARIAATWHRDDPIQGYCDFLSHRMAIATARGADIANDEAFESWVMSGFPGFPLSDDVDS